jgi:hypothetical protein
MRQRGPAATMKSVARAGAQTTSSGGSSCRKALDVYVDILPLLQLSLLAIRCCSWMHTVAVQQLT